MIPSFFLSLDLKIFVSSCLNVSLCELNVEKCMWCGKFTGHLRSTELSGCYMIMLLENNS
jgi:hypothetical protein